MKQNECTVDKIASSLFKTVCSCYLFPWEMGIFLSDAKVYILLEYTYYCTISGVGRKYILGGGGGGQRLT